MRLKRNFFNRPTTIVAKELLGKYLCRRVSGRIIRAKITETEAYCGIKDKASHASKGITPRTEVMFGPAGRTYVYMIYGMYHCLNIVTEKKGYPAAVLIRAAEVINNKSKNIKLNGPGILCRELKIDRKLNNIDVWQSKKLWIESASWRREKIKPSQIKKGKRVGVDYAGKWKDKMWRFYL